MGKSIIGFIFVSICFIFSCDYKKVVDSDQNEYVEILDFLKKDSTFLDYATFHDVVLNDIDFSVSSRNIYPTLPCFKRLINYKNELSSKFNENAFKEILTSFEIKYMNLGMTLKRLRGPFKIYFTKVNGDIFCQVYFKRGFTPEDAGSYIFYQGNSLAYYFIFNRQNKIQKSFVCEIRDC